MMKVKVNNLYQDYEEFFLNKLLQHRQVVINDDIDNITITNAWSSIDYLLRKNSELPILLYINSYGGSTSDGMFLSDYIRSIDSCDIITVGMGTCYSAAFILLCSGKYRLCYKNTTLMIHNCKCDLNDITSRQLESYSEEIKRVDDGLHRLLAEQSKFSLHEIKGKMVDNFDWYMTPTESMLYGFIDDIVMPKANKKLTVTQKNKYKRMV